MRKLFLSTSLLLAATTASIGQTFTITDYNVSGCIYDSPEDIKKDEIKTLGGKVVVAFYDTKLKLTVERDKEEQSIILNKKDDSTYSAVMKLRDGQSTLTLSIDSILGYIRAINFTEYLSTSSNKNCIHSFKAKR